MLNRLENLANEILLMILNYIRWFEMVESFWSLNKRFNDIIYLKLSMTNNGIVISEKCLSFNHSKILRFVNLKKFILKKCYLTKKLIEHLLFLIEYQLDELIFTVDKDVFKLTHYEKMSRIIRHNEESKLMLMFKKFLRTLFSDKCRLISLEVDISNDVSAVDIHKCFSLSSISINNVVVTQCMTLRYLHIHLIYGYFLERIIEHVPALETLSVVFIDSLMKESSYEPRMKRFASTILNWYEKMPKLKCFSLKSVILDDLQLVYLKWIINNVYYIEKLKVRLDIKTRTNETNVIDVKLLFENDIEKIIDSFKNDRIFIDRHWTNVKCYFDRVLLCQHISSIRITKPKLFDDIIDYPMIFNWENVRCMKIDLCPAIYSFLTEFDKIYPHIRSIQFNMGRLSHLAYSTFLQSSLDIVDDIHFQYVTRLDFGSGFWRGSGKLQFYFCDYPK
ncbi:unnamed protein product [Rotaria sordida]|uniref:F-box domain-containing protein n=1 Tax=Rotaria sordida TaxID=392033 RepID=A0A815ESE1_9BILA|nr:unnamed protein product [Rotaria sordida]CAF4023849.1 unnamed protein product [Rotaria sordida]